MAALLVVVTAIGSVRYLEYRDAERAAHADNATASTNSSLHGNPDSAGAPNAAYFASGPSQEVRITRGAHNQFFVTARVNRQAAPFLVDTGASYVALRESDANRAGIFTKAADFTAPVRTANGETRAAFVNVDVMEIDGIRIEDVDAFILPDAQLDMNLLGMSFLSELSSVEARNGELILKS